METLAIAAVTEEVTAAVVTKFPPHDEKIDCAILGALLAWPEAIQKISSRENPIEKY